MDKTGQTQQQQVNFQHRTAAAAQQERAARAQHPSSQAHAASRHQSAKITGVAVVPSNQTRGKQRQTAAADFENLAEVKNDAGSAHCPINPNTFADANVQKQHMAAKRYASALDTSPQAGRKQASVPNSLHLTEQNRKMIKQMKERAIKQQEQQQVQQQKPSKVMQQPNYQSRGGLENVMDPVHPQSSKYSTALQQQTLHNNYKREQRDQRRQQVDIELPDSCRYQSQLDCNDQFMIQSSLDEIRNGHDNFTTDESNTFQESVEKQLEKTPPKKGKRGNAAEGQGNYIGAKPTPVGQGGSRQQHINFPPRFQDEQNELFGALDISPIESQDNFAAQRVSMSKNQLANKQAPGKKSELLSDAKANDHLAQLEEEAVKQANNKRAKEFMTNLQDKLRNLGGNLEVQSPSDALGLQKEGRLGQQSQKIEPKKMAESLSQPAYFKDAEDNERKNVILDVLELKMLNQNASNDKNKAARQEPTSVKKPTQSSSVGPRTDEKCSNSASSNSQKRKQSQPKQGEKVQINSVGLPQHSSSDSSGGSQVEAKEADRQGPNGGKLNPVLPYPNAQADALAFLKGEKVPTDNQLADQESDKEEPKPADSLAAAQPSKQESALISTKQTQNEAPNKDTDKNNVNQTDTEKIDQLHKSHQEIKVEAFQPTASAEMAVPAVVENEFQSYFQEMNDKANDVMSRQQPEPEKGLEFLKQVEDLLKKIQQAQKAIKDKQDDDRRKHIRTEVNDTDRRSPRRGSLADEKKDRNLDDIHGLSYEQSLTERVAQDKKGGLVGGDEDIGLQVSGNDFKNLMGMSPANMLGDLDDESYIFHTIYRTSPCSFTVGTIVTEEPHQIILGQRSKTSLSAPKMRDNALEDGQIRPQTGTLIPKSQQTELNQPYKIQYTISQLSLIEVDPTFKVILFYNMACCYQRLHLNDECTQYLESATKALQERIRLLESQEQTLLHQNHNQNLNTVNIIYAPSSRTSVKHGDELAKDDKHSVVPQLLESAEMHNFNLRNQNPGQRHKENSSMNFYQQKRGGAHPFPKNPNNNDLVIQSLVAPATEVINQHQGSINPPERNLSISQTRMSTSTVHQLQNFKYEKLLAQKMQSLRYQCKLHLQICAVMSQQGMHRDALIFGNKSSHLCYQLIKDAQLLCKRQMQQIRRQRRLMDYDSEEDGEGEEEADSEQDGVYGEMGAGQPSRKGQRQGTGGREAESQKPQIISDEQSINSYSVKSMRTRDRNPRRKRAPKYKRTRSNSTQNSSKKHHNETVEQVGKRLEPLSQIQKKQESSTPSVTQTNSPKKRRGEAAVNEGSRKSHSSDSKQRSYQKGYDSIQIAEMSPEAAQKQGFSLTQQQPLQQISNDQFQPETGEAPRRKDHQGRSRSRNHQQIRSCVSESNRTEQSAMSNASQYSSNSLARIKIRRAFDNQSRSSAAESGATSQRKARNKFHARDNSVSSQMSQESLKKIYSFALKNAKSLHQLQKEQELNDTADAKTNKGSKKRTGDGKRERAKVYYVEEQVKVLSEIIQMADPILTELSSQIFQFEKLTQQKITYKQRDIELFRRYGKDDFMAERDKLNISFHNLKEIKAIQQIKKFKIAVRNTLGLKQLDDWIYNLNIGNVMHLSLMSADELQPIEHITPQAAKHSQINSVAGSTTQYRLQSALEIEQASRDGFISKREKEDLKQQEKNLFETSHDLCKDAMLEKIVLISVAYFCIATEMRFIIQKQKQQKSLQKKDSEMYHAKALHISSLFLPKECPLVQHITQSYNKNYLKDKPEFNLERYLTEELGVDLSEEGGANAGAESASNERAELRIEEQVAEQQRQKSKRSDATHKKAMKDIVDDQMVSRQQPVPSSKTQLVAPPIQLQTSKQSHGSPGKAAANNDESHRLSSENGQDMDEGTSIVINEPTTVKAAKGNNRVKESIAVKKASINQIKRSPAISKVNQGSFNTIKHIQGPNAHGLTSFSKRGSFQTASQPALSVERMKFNYKSYKMAHDVEGMATPSDQGHHETGPQKYRKMAAGGQMRLPPQTPMALQSPNPSGVANSKSLQHLMGQKQHAASSAKMNINNRIVPISKVGVSLGQKGGMSQHPKASASNAHSKPSHPPQTAKHGVQRHYINLAEMEEKNISALSSTHPHKAKQGHRKANADGTQQRLNTDGQVHQIGRSSSGAGMTTAQYLRHSQEQLATDGASHSPKQSKKKFEGLLNFFYKKE